MTIILVGVAIIGVAVIAAGILAAVAYGIAWVLQWFHDEHWIETEAERVRENAKIEKVTQRLTFRNGR